MTAPKISIIVPVYNLEEYVKKCLDSIFAQTIKDIEVIAVDDGSCDSSGKILDEYAENESRLKVIHKQNGGVSAARLDGILAARGEYIGFVDADDEIECDMYERLLNNAIINNADISHCGHKIVFSDSSVKYFYNTGKTLAQNREEALIALLRGEYIEPGLCSKLFSSCVIRRALSLNDIDKTIRNNEDLLLNYYFFKHSEISVYEDFCPYLYFSRDGSASHSINEHSLLDPSRVRQIIADDARKWSENVKDAAQYSLAYSLISLATMSEKKAVQLIRPAKREAKKKLREMLGMIKQNKQCSKKVYLLSCLAAYMPTAYRIIHNIYAKITGADKKYTRD